MSLGIATTSPRWKAVRLAADPWAVVTALIVVAAVVIRAVLPTNEDVSWLIDLAERTRDGARPYLDYFEVNPPASIGLYLPAALLASGLRIATETVTTGLVFLGGALSLLIAGRILRRTGLLSAAALMPVTTAASAVVFVLPAYAFAEREHIIILALLPMLACMAARCSGSEPKRFETVLAGLGLGIVVAVKPVFLLGIAGPVLCLLAARGGRAVATDLALWIGAILAIAYASAVLRFVPTYADQVLPAVMATYLPRRLPLFALLGPISIAPWLVPLLASLALRQSRPIGWPATCLLAASMGFEACFLLQGKGFAYQAYPAVSLALLALALAVGHLGLKQVSPKDAALAFGAFAAATLLGWSLFDRHLDPAVYAPGLAEAVKANGPRPKVLAISPALALGHPFVRDQGGTWAGSAPCTFVTDGVDTLTREGPRPDLQHFVAEEQARYAADIRRNSPDLVLVDGPRWQSWIGGSSVLADAMSSYRQAGQFGPVTLWRHKDPDAKDHAS